MIVLSGMLAGCGHERSYCDATGCYSCDGFDCRRTGDSGDGGVLGDGGTVADAAAPSCTTDGDCAAGYRCSAGECRATTDLCQFNSECGAGRECVDGRCLAQCTTAADCPSPATQTCTAGVCQCINASCTVDDHPQPFCTDDTQCQPGHPCVGGICRTPCQTHDDCLRFDVQFNYCLDGYCATTNEATSNCALSVDCANGKTCVDGVCQ